MSPCPIDKRVAWQTHHDQHITAILTSLGSLLSNKIRWLLAAPRICFRFIIKMLLNHILWLSILTGERRGKRRGKDTIIRVTVALGSLFFFLVHYPFLTICSSGSLFLTTDCVWGWLRNFLFHLNQFSLVSCGVIGSYYFWMQRIIYIIKAGFLVVITFSHRYILSGYTENGFCHKTTLRKEKSGKKKHCGEHIWIGIPRIDQPF